MKRTALLIRTFLVLAFASLLAAQSPEHARRPPRYLDPLAARFQAALPPPPALGSLAAQADLETVLQVQVWRTPEQAALAQRLVQDDPFKFSEVLGPGFTPASLPRTADFLEQVIADTVSVNTALKDRYLRKRPHLLDPRVEPSLPRTSSPAYPSGHSTRAYVMAAVLTELFPDRAEALLNYARKAAWARVQGGIHFPTDLEGGRLLAVAIIEVLRASEGYRTARDACRSEIADWSRRAGG